MPDDEKILQVIKRCREEKSPYLDLGGFELTEIPRKVYELTHLTELNLKKNRLEYVSTGISRLKNLEMLFLDDNYMREFPMEILTLPSLISLILHNNFLTRLPGEIKNLRKLTLSANKITAIPDGIGSLKRLHSHIPGRLYLELEVLS